MLVQDYPSSATARDCLARVTEMGVVVEAVNVTSFLVVGVPEAGAAVLLVG